MCQMFCFFFSSRRRHTRCSRDWSSDVCSSDLLPTVERHLGSLEFNRALEAIWSLVQLGNQYIDKSAPWTLAKQPEDQPRLNTVLYNAAETLRFLCLALHPFMPQAAEEMKRQLGLVLNFSKPLLASEITW